MIQQNHAVGDVLLQPMPRQRSFSLLGRHHRRKVAVLQPAEQPPQFRAQDRHIGEPGKERFQRVQNHPLRSHRIHGVLQPDEQALQIVVAGLMNLARLDPHEIQEQLLLVG